jgi:hypothetical protein
VRQNALVDEPHENAELDDLVAEVRGAVAARRGPWFDPEAGETVLLPEGSGRGYWVGAPSVAVDGDDVLLSYRRRRPRDGSRNERGHLAAIARSSDGGRSFSDVWALSKHDVGTSSLERFCLRRAIGGQGWFLYTSWEDPPSSGRWRIDVLRADGPDRFNLASAEPVLHPGAVGVDALKDPYIVNHQGELLMYVSTFLTRRGPAPTCLAASTDGTRFSWRGQVLGVGLGWDSYQARLSSIFSVVGGFACYYDGAGSPEDDTEEHCGLGVSTDLLTWRRVSVERPLFVSAHASRSLRYVEVAQVGGSRYVYYEYARPDGSHELRRSPLVP